MTSASSRPGVAARSARRAADPPPATGWIWEATGGGCCSGRRGRYAARIEPDGHGGHPFASFRAHVVLAGTGRSRPMAVRSGLENMRVARAWVAATVADAYRRALGHGDAGARVVFEVAVHIDGRDCDTVDAHLAQRMTQEARRRRLKDPVRVDHAVCRRTPGRPAKVWICAGLPA